MEYKIRKSSYRCARCEREFELGEGYRSVLRLGAEEPERLDYCEPCFEEPGDEDAVAHWRARRTEPPSRKKAVDFAMLRELFFKMVEHHGEEYAKVAYLLGLVLIRKRRLKLIEFATDDGVDYLVVTGPDRKEPIRVLAPELNRDEYGALRDKLTCLLDIEFDEEEPLRVPGDLIDAERDAADPVADATPSAPEAD